MILFDEYKPIFVRWLDHSAFDSNNWHEMSSTMSDITPFEVVTLGYLLKEEEDYIIVASTITSNENTLGEFCILKACIKERRDLV